MKDWVWYLKYLSASIILVAIALHTIPEAYPYNIIVHLVGAILWTIVGIKWKEMDDLNARIQMDKIRNFDTSTLISQKEYLDKFIYLKKET